MNYQSPIRLYSYLNIETSEIVTSSESIVNDQIRDRIDADTNELILLDNFSYSKNDILSDLDNPNWKKNLKYHILIWENKGLLEFLEEGRLNLLNARKEWFKLSTDKDFVDFVSPYFSELFSDKMEEFINPINFESAKIWLSFLDFVNSKDEQIALKSTRAFLDDSIVMFQELEKTNYNSKLDNIYPWTDQQWHLFMNSLPESLLPDKERIAGAIRKFINKIGDSEINITYYISIRLSKLDNLSPALTALIQKDKNTLSTCYDKIEGTDQIDAGNSDSKKAILYLLLTIALIRLLISLVRCSG